MFDLRNHHSSQLITLLAAIEVMINGLSDGSSQKHELNSYRIIVNAALDVAIEREAEEKAIERIKQEIRMN